MSRSSYRDDVIRLAQKVSNEATLRRVYKILDREYSAAGTQLNSGNTGDAGKEAKA